MVPIALGWKHTYIEMLYGVKSSWPAQPRQLWGTTERECGGVATDLGRQRRRVVKSREVAGPLMSSSCFPPRPWQYCFSCFNTRRICHKGEGKQKLSMPVSLALQLSTRHWLPSEMPTPNKAVQDVCSECCATAVHVGYKATQGGLEEKQTACQETHLSLLPGQAKMCTGLQWFCIVRNNGYFTLQERKHSTKSQYTLKGQEMVCWVQGSKIHALS